MVVLHLYYIFCKLTHFWDSDKTFSVFVTELWKKYCLIQMVKREQVVELFCNYFLQGYIKNFCLVFIVEWHFCFNKNQFLVSYIYLIDVSLGFCNDDRVWQVSLSVSYIFDSLLPVTVRQKSVRKTVGCQKVLKMYCCQFPFR